MKHNQEQKQQGRSDEDEGQDRRHYEDDEATRLSRGCYYNDDGMGSRLTIGDLGGVWDEESLRIGQDENEGREQGRYSSRGYGNDYAGESAVRRQVQGNDGERRTSH